MGPLGNDTFVGYNNDISSLQVDMPITKRAYKIKNAYPIGHWLVSATDAAVLAREVVAT
jgi:hypothetical protein